MNETAIVKREELLPEVRNMESLAKHLLDSKLFPGAGSLAGVITVIEYGRELGIPPVASLQTICVISGKMCIEAKAMLAVASKNAGVTWKVDALDDNGCTMTFMRPSAPPIVVSFSIKEAKDAGLLSKSNWKLYPQDMLFARCASRGVRRIAPDAVLGLYSTEEMRDVQEIEKMGIPVPSDREVQALKVKPKKAESIPEELAVDEPMPEPPPLDKDEPLFDPVTGEQVMVESEPEVDPEEEEAPRLTEDMVLNSYIAQLHDATERAGVDEAKWKEWLIGQGKKMNRLFVGRIGKVLRYHQGKPDDVKYLVSVIDRAIGLYIKETTKE